MKPSDFQKTIQCQFDCKLKKVVKGIVRNYRKELARRQAKEVSFCELPEIVVEKLIVWDDYESEYTTFDVCGTEIRVRNAHRSHPCRCCARPRPNSAPTRPASHNSYRLPCLPVYRLGRTHASNVCSNCWVCCGTVESMTDDLFAAMDAPDDVTRPLAVRMRPASIDDVVGQSRVLGEV